MGTACYLLLLLLVPASQSEPMFEWLLNLTPAQYSSAYETAYSMLGWREGQMMSNLDRAKRANKVQETVSSSVAFPCDITWGRSPQRPISVHALRPGDIDVIGAMGDSITAAFGGTATDVIRAVIANRGISWSAGGLGTWREFLTLPNILKEFNPKLIGYSLGDSLAWHRRAQFNTAEAWAFSSDMRHQAELMIKRMRSDSRVDYDNDWKMMTLLFGSNDFCYHMCQSNLTHVRLLENHRRDLMSVLDYIYKNMPRVLVNLVVAPSMMKMQALTNKPLFCQMANSFQCPCVHGLRYQGGSYREEFEEVVRTWQRVEEEVGHSPRYQAKEDFAVVVQPFLQEMPVVTRNTGLGQLTDYSYYSPDCLHYSQKGNAMLANGLWNNLLEPVGLKTRRGTTHLMTPFLCPSPSRPYIFTPRNSRVHPYTNFDPSVISPRDDEHSHLPAKDFPGSDVIAEKGGGGYPIDGVVQSRENVNYVIGDVSTHESDVTDIKNNQYVNNGIVVAGNSETIANNVHVSNGNHQQYIRVDLPIADEQNTNNAVLVTNNNIQYVSNELAPVKNNEQEVNNDVTQVVSHQLVAKDDTQAKSNVQYVAFQVTDTKSDDQSSVQHHHVASNEVTPTQNIQYVNINPVPVRNVENYYTYVTDTTSQQQGEKDQASDRTDFIVTNSRQTPNQDDIIGTNSRPVLDNRDVITTNRRHVTASNSPRPSSPVNPAEITNQLVSSPLESNTQPIVQRFYLVGANGEAIPNHEDIREANSRLVPRNGDVIGTNSRLVPQNGDVIGTNSRLVPQNSYVIGTNSRLVPQNGDVIGTNSRLVPQNGDVTGTNSRLVPQNSYVIGANSRLVPQSSDVTGTNSRLVPQNSYVIGTNSRLVPQSSDVIETNSRLSYDSDDVIRTRRVNDRAMEETHIQKIPGKGTQQELDNFAYPTRDYETLVAFTYQPSQVLADVAKAASVVPTQLVAHSEVQPRIVKPEHKASSAGHNLTTENVYLVRTINPNERAKVTVKTTYGKSFADPTTEEDNSTTPRSTPNYTVATNKQTLNTTTITITNSREVDRNTTFEDALLNITRNTLRSGRRIFRELVKRIFS